MSDPTPNYQMRPVSIKRIMLEELQRIYNDARRVTRNNFLNDLPLRWVENSYDTMVQQIHDAQDYDALNTICEEWYRMSLQDWVSSL